MTFAVIFLSIALNLSAALAPETPQRAHCLDGDRECEMWMSYQEDRLNEDRLNEDRIDFNQ